VKRETVAGTNVTISKAQEEGAKAGLARAEATLDKTIVRAPFDGVVVLKDAEVGEVVSPNSQGGSNARGSVVTMVDFASLEVQADVPETSLNAVRKGGRARIFLDAFPEDSYEGTVDRIWPTADRQTGTVEVRVVFDEPDGKLRPEMGVRVVFLSEDQPAEPEAAAPAGPLVPETATVRDGTRTGVFVLERDVARFREVRIGARRGGRIAVDSGLTPGERIIDRPPPTLNDGDRVRIRE
jgi:RND family efflux transporter MFP subunit